MVTNNSSTCVNSETELEQIAAMVAKGNIGKEILGQIDSVLAVEANEKSLVASQEAEQGKAIASINTGDLVGLEELVRR